ncbi:F-box and WD-40 domain protein 7 [Nematocida minor]|uniref:F-box and WD-40 domain protein 7 n=1 Tax=Nematocida minor TaxID=1912983 RepID=UPI00221F19F8|nr:F-box and WD-40 domain protein 7 [Nematocida minor]KAI5190067.1 F-box and WD-40 domain protein 7 [Nematocida minor]
MAIIENIFPLEMLSKITKHLGMHDIKRLMCSSETVKTAIEKNPVIWKQKLKNKETSCSNGNYLVAVKKEHLVTLDWINNQVKQVRTISHHPSVYITKIKAYGDIIIVASNSSYIYVLDKSLNLIKTLNKHKGSIWAFDYMNNILASGSTDRTAKIWDAFLGVCLKTFIGHTSTIRTVLLTDEYVITGSRDFTIRIWSIRTGVCKHLLTGHKGSIRDMVLIKDKPYLVTGSYDGTSILWNYQIGEGVRYLIKLPRRIYKVKSLGKYVAIAGMDQNLYIVTLEGKLLFSGRTQHGTIFQIRIDSEGYVYTLTASGVLSKWNIETGQEVYQIETNTKSVDFSVINHLLVVGLTNRVDLYYRDTGKYIRTVVSVELLYSLYCEDETIVYGHAERGKTQISIIKFANS